MCGEKKRGQAAFCAVPGSPPRVRGKDEIADSVHAVVGITPACAGKSPRHCRRKKEIRGSPPRVRGKERCRPARGWRSRITPACAGKSSLCGNQIRVRRDHPRVCGEKACATGRGRTALGSPPRVRGKVVGELINFKSEWITPACAGKRQCLNLRRPAIRDHPRVCGEKNVKQLVKIPWRGSPPRVRGKVNKFNEPLRRGGITPACAGKSS